MSVCVCVCARALTLKGTHACALTCMHLGRDREEREGGQWNTRNGVDNMKTVKMVHRLSNTQHLSNYGLSLSLSHTHTALLPTDTRTMPLLAVCKHTQCFNTNRLSTGLSTHHLTHVSDYLYTQSNTHTTHISLSTDCHQHTHNTHLTTYTLSPTHTQHTSHYLHTVTNTHTTHISLSTDCHQHTHYTHLTTYTLSPTHTHNTHLTTYTLSPTHTQGLTTFPPTDAQPGT